VGSGARLPPGWRDRVLASSAAFSLPWGTSTSNPSIFCSRHRRRNDPRSMPNTCCRHLLAASERMLTAAPNRDADADSIAGGLWSTSPGFTSHTQGLSDRCLAEFLEELVLRVRGGHRRRRPG
jgi:hypothetical protein